MRKALITGITGQDGSYLAELLLGKGYEVWGIIRRSSSFNTDRIDHLYRDPHEKPKLRLVYGDLTDGANLSAILNDIKPDEVYNLGAQSHVRVSFDMPIYTVNADGARHASHARGRAVLPHADPVLPGFQQRDVRQGHGDPADGDDALPPAQPLRLCEGLRLLADGELPRGVRPVRLQRHPVQPRIAPTRRDVRHAQDHPGRHADQVRPAGRSSTWATWTPNATGDSPATTSRPCG